MRKSRQHERLLTLWLRSDMFMQAGRRLLAEKMAKYKPVYSYRFDQPAENSTIETGVRRFFRCPALPAD